MGLPRSTYYDAPPVKTDDAEIVANITAICDEFEAYGYRRVGAELRHRGMVVNSKKIRRLIGLRIYHPVSLASKRGDALRSAIQDANEARTTFQATPMMCTRRLAGPAGAVGSVLIGLQTEDANIVLS